MSVLKRLSRLIKSNLNDMVDSMQDPGKEIDQMLIDMQESAKKARAEVAGCMVEEKRLAKRVQALKDEGAQWEEKAMLAVKSGDDGLAKEALKRKGEKDAEAAEMQKALVEQEVQVNNLASALKALDARVKEVNLRKNSLKEKARMAKGDDVFAGKTGAFADFERMSGKIDEIEATAGLSDELSGQDAASLAASRKLDALAEDSEMDDALAALKAKLDKP